MNDFLTINKDVSFFKKIGYTRFIKWFTEQLNNDRKYIEENGVYSYIFTFETNREIKNLKPNYPWNNYIINNFWKNLELEISSEEIIYKKNIYIKELEKKIKLLENKHKK